MGPFQGGGGTFSCPTFQSSVPSRSLRLVRFLVLSGSARCVTLLAPYLISCFSVPFVLYRFTLTALLLFLLVLELSLFLLVALLGLLLRTPWLSSFVVSSFNHCLLLQFLSLLPILLLLPVLLLSVLIAFGLWPPLPLSLGIFLFLLFLRLLLGVLPVFTSFYLRDVQFKSSQGFSLGPVVAAGAVIYCGFGLFCLGVLFLGVCAFLLVASGVPFCGFASLVLLLFHRAAVFRLLRHACSVPSGLLCP